MNPHHELKKEIVKEDREAAARFYFKELTAVQVDWIEAGINEEEVDPDVVSLAALLSEYRFNAEMRGFMKVMAFFSGPAMMPVTSAPPQK